MARKRAARRPEKLGQNRPSLNKPSNKAAQNYLTGKMIEELDSASREAISDGTSQIDMLVDMVRRIAPDITP